MLVRFSVRRILALMAVDWLGSIGLLLVAARLRASIGQVPVSVMEALTSVGIPIDYLLDTSREYLLPTAVIVLVAVIWPLFFLVFSVYDGERNDTLRAELGHVCMAILTSFMALAGILYFTYRNTSRLTLLMFVGLDLALLLGARVALWMWRRIAGRATQPYRPAVIVVGAGDVGRRVATQLERYANADFRVIGYVDDDPEKRRAAIDGLPVLGTLDEVAHLAAGHYVKDAVVALPLRAHRRLVQVCRALQEVSVRVHVVPDLLALSFPGAGLQGFGGIPVINLGQTGIDGWRLLWKRTFDLAVATVLVGCLAPVMVLTAVAIKLDSRGPVIYRQRRIGRNHRPFEMLKFRSMKVDVSSAAHREHMKRLITQNLTLDDLAAEGKASLKMESDERITRVGSFLRKTSLDELPQLFNVLKGEMSLVGPRPSIEYEVELYQDWHRRRLEAAPGITGLWQVRGRNRVSFDEMVRMDLDYIARQSLWLDIKILLRTPLAVANGVGAG